MISSRLHRIQNLGNSYFCISCVNALIACPPFTDQLLNPEREKQIRKGKGRVFKDIINICTAQPFDLQCVKSLRTNVALHYRSTNNWSTSATNFDDGNEHDPEEFMRALLDCLNDEFESNHNWVELLTEILMCEVHTCPSCTYKREVTIKDMVLQLSAEASSLQDGIRRKLGDEVI